MGAVLRCSVCLTLRLVGGCNPGRERRVVLIGRYVPLAIAWSGPVLLNIIAYHVTMQPHGAQPAVLTVICWVILFLALPRSIDNAVNGIVKLLVKQFQKAKLI